MRNLLLGLCILFSGSTLNAQITITSSDMPDDGDIYIYSVAQDQWNTNPNNTGANYTWDFSFLAPDFQRSDTFLSVGSTPLAYQFFFNNNLLYPDYYSQHALEAFTGGGGGGGGGPVQIEDVYNYYKVDQSAYIQTGFGARINGVPTSQQYSQRDFIFQFPMTYGSTDNNFASYLIDLPTIGSYGQDIQRNNEVDGWGTLITPLGTYQVLRVRTELIYTDTFYVAQFGFGTQFTRPPEYEYKWIAQNGGTPIVTLSEFGGGMGGTQYSFTYQDSVRTVNVDSELGAYAAPNVYPVPAGEYFYVSIPDGLNVSDLKLELFDLQGQLTTITIREGADRLEVDRGALAAGVYLLKMETPVKTWYQKVVLD